MGRRLVGTFVGVAVFTASLTVLYLTMREVMAVGGSCASGGPYTVAVPCPRGAWMAPVSIFTGLAGVAAVFLWRPRGGPLLGLLAWPALFLALGWNFLDHGLDGPDGGGIAIGWLVCAAVFVAMGGVPLLVVGRMAVLGDGDAPPRPGTAAHLATVASRRPSATREATSWLVETSARTAPGGDDADDNGDDDVVDDLERLARLHRDGQLTDAEFTAAKHGLLGGS